MKESPSESSQKFSTLLRYRIGLLADEKNGKALCTAFDREASRRVYLDTSNDVDLVDTALVYILQLVCDRILGK